MTSATDNPTRIQPQFLSLDGVSIRYATSHRPDVPTLLMLSPWPESIFAYLPTWDAWLPASPWSPSTCPALAGRRAGPS
jgi:hypothetical protein